MAWEGQWTVVRYGKRRNQVALTSGDHRGRLAWWKDRAHPNPCEGWVHSPFSNPLGAG